jgi:hypothetical protein
MVSVPDRLLIADEKELTADTPGADRKLVGT